MARTHELKVMLNDVALLRATKQIVNGDRPGPLHLRGMILPEVAVVVEYEVVEGYVSGYEVVAVETDTEQRRLFCARWEPSKNIIAITDGPLFDMIVEAVAADHDSHIRSKIDDDVCARDEDAAYDAADYRAELRRDAA